MNGQGREVVIVEAVRTPIGRGHPEKGYYKDVHAADLLGRVYREVVARAGFDASEASTSRATRGWPRACRSRRRRRHWTCSAARRSRRSTSRRR
jgi:hypothetical protein